MLNKHGIKVEVKRKLPKLQEVEVKGIPTVRLLRGEEYIELPANHSLVNTLILENYKIIK